MEVTDENYDIFSPKEKDEIKTLHSSKKITASAINTNSYFFTTQLHTIYFKKMKPRLLASALSGISDERDG